MSIKKLEILNPIDRQQAPCESESQTIEQQRLMVLLAMTDSPMRDRLYRLLSKDCQVVCAKTVRRAAQLIRHDHFDLVICDLELPSSGGMALLNFVKLQAPQTPVILGLPEFDARIRRQAILHGALDCYVKPMSAKAVKFLIPYVKFGSRMIPDVEMDGGMGCGARSLEKSGR